MYKAVSYTHLCVVGGGNTALEEALFLSGLCKTVHLIHRRDEFRGHQTTVERIKNTPNIVLHLGYNIASIEGSNAVEKVVLTGKSHEEIPLQGVFVAIGLQPDNQMFAPMVSLDEAGYIIAGEDCKTNLPGVFVAGDTRTKEVRQLVTAAGDGAVAATAAAQYIHTVL